MVLTFAPEFFKALAGVKISPFDSPSVNTITISATSARLPESCSRTSAVYSRANPMLEPKALYNDNVEETNYNKIK